MNLAMNLTTAARCGDRRAAVRLDDQVWSYGALDDASGRLAGLLRSRGITPGERVGIMLPNVPEFPMAYYGVLRAGGIVVPINPGLKEREVTYYLEDCGVRLIFAWDDDADAAEAAAARAGVDCVRVKPGYKELLAGRDPDRTVEERAGNDTAVILYTSGTTGHPKGAELTHDNMARNAEVTASTLLRLGADDVVLSALPLFHSFGQTCTLNATISAGASLTLLAVFYPSRALEVIQRDRVSVFAGVPTMYVALSQASAQEYDTSSLRLCISGGAALPVEVLRRFEETFECPILEGYGLSETSPVASFNHPDRERKPGSIGTPIAGVEMRLVDDDGVDVPPGAVGEIAIRGHNVMKGYWGQPEATRAASPDGWFRTGDLARCDEDGYFFIVDRKKDLILRGGFNVYPREVEEVLHEHPAVAQVAVIGVPHPTLGEEVAAVVVLRPGASATPVELRNHVKAQLADYKYPRTVRIVDALPVGPTGKILKREIKLPAPEPKR
jgi:long-chain acyl-CoA synthetase